MKRYRVIVGGAAIYETPAGESERHLKRAFTVGEVVQEDELSPGMLESFVEHGAFVECD